MDSIYNKSEFELLQTKLAESVNFETLSTWAARIEESAKKLHDENPNKIKVCAKKDGVNVSISYSPMDDLLSVECIIDAIQELLSGMENPVTQAYFQNTLEMILEPERKRLRGF